MSQTLQLGPLALPLAPVLLLVGFLLGGVAGRRLGRRSGVDIDPLLWRLLLVGLFVARLAFVLQFQDAYLKAPLDILDVRDGGWAPWAAYAAAAAYALAMGWRGAAVRRPLAAALAAMGLVWLAGIGLGSAFETAEQRLPEMSLQSLAGVPVALSQFEGKPTVINLWATWCPPCRREMPVLLQAQAERPDVNFVFLNQGETASRVQEFLAAQRLPLRNVLLDPRGEAGIRLGHRALPTTLFFDSRGQLLATRVGELSRATLAQRLPPPN
jgi:thiol-disulfide isomerase/thioredoxin